MRAPSKWDILAEQLESEARTVGGVDSARELKARVQDAIALVENDSSAADIVDRLDHLLMLLTDASRENVCTNTKCPHYSKRCRMR